MRTNTKDNFNKSFSDTTEPDKKAIRVTNISAFQPPAECDYIDVDTSGSTTDTFTYKSGGSSGTTLAIVTVEYQSSSKVDIDYVEVS